MKLTLQDVQEDREAFLQAGIGLPAYDAATVQQIGRETPVWAHFGIGNIFRIFIGSIVDRLITEGSLASGLTCVETFDPEVVDRIYRPHDNLMLRVILNNDGSVKRSVIAPFAEAIFGNSADPASWRRLREIFRAPSLQMASFTITEKGYALTGTDGGYTRLAQENFRKGPEHCAHCMSVVTAMLYERYRAGRLPIALVSMDNCSHNGKRLQEAVWAVADAWLANGFVDEGFRDYVRDENTVAFPWTMIDKITPRPSESVAALLKKEGVEDIDPIVTAKKTFIAPFGNAEEAQYLVVEDHFPNGRPRLEDGGVYMTDRETVNKAERMKVNTCLNPIHTALCTYDCMLGYDLFADGMRDPELSRLAHRIGYTEGLPVVSDPKILSPRAFLDEVVNVRMPNPYLGDTSQRIATDISQMVGIRFGETIKSYVRRDGTAAGLTGIPLAIAGWLRYLMALDDDGKPFSLAPDPLIPELQQQMAGIVFGQPETADGKLLPLLSNANLFGIDLYQAGIGEKCETYFREEIAGPGAVRKTLKKELDTADRSDAESGE